jgi:4-hydroxy-3-methylbut-2-en-1-yl diphosphate reductase
MKVTIDENSGYCFGVEFAIQMAEDEMAEEGQLYCLGDIVHNSMEVKRLHDKGLRIINREQLKELKEAKVLIRAHGEPPETYQTAIENNLTLVDASCPVVLKLQNRVKYAYDHIRPQKGQIVIYGQQGHAEVEGISGQTHNEAIVITGEQDLNKIDFNRPITLFSQTTKSTAGFYRIKELIEERIISIHGELKEEMFDANDSICRQVSNREPQLEKFAHQHEVIIFVSGRKSSNGQALYKVCKTSNPKSYFVENADELEPKWFDQVETVGICGATSTPMWLMEQVSQAILVQQTIVH